MSDDKPTGRKALQAAGYVRHKYMMAELCMNCSHKQFDQTLRSLQCGLFAIRVSDYGHCAKWAGEHKGATNE